MTEKRNWIIIRMPNWPNTIGVTDSLIYHASIDQEQSPGISGGTTARKLLTKKEAHEACERLAKNHHILNRDMVYVPVELGPVYRSNQVVNYEFKIEE